MKTNLLISFGLLFCMVIFCPIKANAQEIAVQTAVKADVSIPLRDMKPAKKNFWDKLKHENEMEVPNKFRTLPDGFTPDGALQKIYNNGSKAAATVPLVNFNGTTNASNSGRVTPPDPAGDVGPNHYVQVVNSMLQIFSKTGTSLYGPVMTSTLWSGFSGNWNGHNNGDAIVLYDENADRWIITQFAIDCPGTPYTEYEMVAVSTTSDPTGSYYRYAFQFDYMPDYPKLGVWQDGYYMAVNRFNTNSGGTYVGVGACVLERSKMLTGDASARMVYFKTETLGGSGSAAGGNCWAMMPSDCDGTLPAAGTPNYFAYIDGNNTAELRLWALHADWVTTTNSTFTYVTALPVAAYTGMGSGSVPEQGTLSLDALGDRLMFRNQYRKFGSYETFVTCHSVNSGSGVAGIRWYEYRKTGSTFSLYQQSTFAPGDGKSRWMGSVAMNANGDIGLAYSVSSSTMYPSIWFTGRKASDPLNQMTVAEGVIQTGTVSMTTYSRWGDYSALNVDPSDNTTFWTTQEYVGTFGGWCPWATKIASFKIASAPVATTLAATSVTSTGATLNGTVNPNGLAATYYFQWGTTTSYGNTTTSTSAGSGTTAVAESASLASLTGGITYHYRLVATNSDGTSYGNDFTFTTLCGTTIPVSISIAASANPFCLGTSVTFTATPVNGGTAPVYQWKVNAINAGTGGATYSYSPAANDAVTCILTSSELCTTGNPATSNTLTMLVKPTLAVGSIGANQAICAGSVPAQLSGIAPSNGTNPTYQWQSSLNNSTFTNISGATMLNYQPGALTVATYFRLLQNADGTCGGPLPTNTVTITLNPALVVGTISANQTICAGSVPVQLNGIAPSNGSNPTYQWQSSLNNSIFTNISGATMLNYQPGALTTLTYFRQMQNATGTCGGPLPTNAITITLTPALAVGSISANQTICAGSVPGQLNGIAPSNGTSPTYQWQSSLNNSIFTNISGATMLNYQPGALTTSTYFRQMQNTTGTCGGPLPTNTVTITINPALVVGSISATQTICAGSVPAQLTGVAPSNGTNATYQWQSSINNITFANISGATMLNYQPGALTAATYFRQLQNADGTCGGPVATNTVTIMMNPILSVGSISANQAICTGSVPAQLTGIAPSNGPNPTYQWQSSLNNATFSNISGATMLNYQPGVLTATTYFRQMQNASGTCGGPLPTNTVTIMMNPSLTVGSISSNQDICASGTPAQLIGIAPSNGVTPTYQWQSSLNNITFNNISGATLLNYQPGVLTATTYFREMQNAAGTCGGPLPTNTVTVAVNPMLPVSVSIILSDNPPICAGSSVIFSATPVNGGTSPAYQWKVNGIAVPGATNAYFGYFPSNNDVIACILTSNAPCATGNPAISNSITMTVLPSLAIGSISANQEICGAGIPVQLNGISPSNGTNPTYQWQSSLNNITFANIGGATMLNYQPGLLTATTYFRQIQNSSGTCGGPLTTNIVTMTVNPLLPVSVSIAASANPV